MNGKTDFYTLKGYQRKKNSVITMAMEDYLEMVCRNALKEGYVRISSLAEKLNVRPSSASKMVYSLKTLGLVDFEKYGIIKPTQAGWELGNYLLHRHDVLHAFFCMVNGSDNELEQVEQIEHYINEATVTNIEKWLDKK